MKNFLKKIAVFLAIIAAISATFGIILRGPVYAKEEPSKRIDGESCTSFLGMTNWDCGFQEMEGENAQDKLVSNIAIIASNILTDITVIASYLVIGYVMYGGYLYMFSAGDPAKAAAGKKTLTQAFIGLAIVLSASTIFSAIRIALIYNADPNLTDLSRCNPLSDTPCIQPGKMVTNLIQWVTGVAGVVCAAFIVVGGWGYITAAGDPGKLTKAKNTLLYAIIGLIIVALTEVLTAFVSNLVRDANETGYLEPTSIVAEINNKEIVNETT